MDYRKSPIDMYQLRRDGEWIMTGTEQECWTWLHNQHAYSVHHALAHEGYDMEPIYVLPKRAEGQR